MNETKVLAPIQDEQQVQDVARVADALSLSLLFTLGRQYLDVPFGCDRVSSPVENRCRTAGGNADGTA